jgi:hypothetical protein
MESMNERKKRTTTRLLYCIPYYLTKKNKQTNITEGETCVYLASPNRTYCYGARRGEPPSRTLRRPVEGPNLSLAS